jgi:hypothetical protein
MLTGKPAMIIVFQQTGGIMGVQKSCRVESRHLDIQEQQSLEDMVKQCCCSGSQRDLSSGKDVFQYYISVSMETGVTAEDSYELCFDDLTLPAKCRPLVEYLQRFSSPAQ